MQEKNDYVQIVSQLPRVREFLSPLPISTCKTYRTALVHLNRLLESIYGENVDSVVDKLKPRDRFSDAEIDVYRLFNQFIEYLPKASPNMTEISINNYVNGGVKKYFRKNRIDMQWFKDSVRLPPMLESDRTAIDKDDIRNFLKVCKLDRLKSYLIVLATSAMRDTSDACTVRNKDVNDSSSPTRITIRGQFSKRKQKRERIVYISDEATEYLNRWKTKEEREAEPDALLFSRNDYRPIPQTVEDTKRVAHNLYQRFNEEFHKILETLKMDQREEYGAKPRRKITMHLFRHFASTTLENHSAKGYHDYILGHSKAKRQYHTQKEDKAAQDYLAIMSELTFFDFTAQEGKLRDTESRLDTKDLQIAELNRQVLKLNTKDQEKEEEILGYLNMVKKLVKENDEQKSRIAGLEKNAIDPAQLERVSELIHKLEKLKKI